MMPGASITDTGTATYSMHITTYAPMMNPITPSAVNTATRIDTSSTGSIRRRPIDRLRPMPARRPDSSSTVAVITAPDSSGCSTPLIAVCTSVNDRIWLTGAIGPLPLSPG